MNQENSRLEALNPHGGAVARYKTAITKEKHEKLETIKQKAIAI